ncbi:MAG: response regulator [Geobacter sp.]|nr:response regulator [Geobacter sp.]
MSLVGNLEDLGLGEILQIVSLSRKSGVLTLHSRGREGRVVFRLGQVIGASSSALNANLGELLIRKGVIDLSLLREALIRQDEGEFTERLGLILIRHYNVPPESIENVVREQIEGVVYSLFAWAEGTFDFELNEDVEAIDDAKIDPLQFMLQQGVNPQFLAMEGSRLADEKRHRGEQDDIVEEEGAPDEVNVDFAFDLLRGPEPCETSADSLPPPGRPLVMVDDDPVMRETLAAVLEGDGYQVTPFEKAEETLIGIDTLYRDGVRPTLLIDLIMPKMDGTGVLGGLELLELVHNNFPDLPVLAMADYHSADAERRVVGYGYTHIMKPRRGEADSGSVEEEFRPTLLAALQRVEAGEKPPEWSAGVNIADELRLEMGEDLGPMTDMVVQSTGISHLRGMLEELNNPSLGGGIILLVLRFASEFMNRAVVFMVKKEEIAGLGQFGMQDESGDPNDHVRRLKVSRHEPSLFTQVLESRLPAKVIPGDSQADSRILRELGGGKPAEVFLGPIISEGKVVAVLYGDNLAGQDPIGDTEALEIFLSQAGLAMEKALLQRRLRGNIQEEP